MLHGHDAISSMSSKTWISPKLSPNWRARVAQTRRVTESGLPRLHYPSALHEAPNVANAERRLANKVNNSFAAKNHVQSCSCIS